MAAEEYSTYSIRLKKGERLHLERLAESTGRIPADVIRRLLLIADIPEVRRALGVLEPIQKQPEAEGGQ